MLVVLMVLIGVFPIVANAQESQTALESTSVCLEDVNEDGAITYIDVLDYVVLTTTSKYEADSQQSKDLWSIHEEVRKLSEAEAKEIVEEIILNY